MKTIYLCGPINGCSDGEAKDWRSEAKSALGGRFNFLDPMRRDYRGRELELGIAKEIVDGDKEDLRNSDILLAFCPKPSVGTSMEVFLFHYSGKPVIVVHPGANPSPWLIQHCEILTDNFKTAFWHLENNL